MIHQDPHGAGGELVWRGGSDLARRSDSIARRALQELAPEEGGTVIVTKDCPHVARVGVHAPTPIVRVETEGDALALIEARDVDLLVIGSDVRSRFSGPLWSLVRGQVPCLCLRMREVAERPFLLHDGHGTFQLLWWEEGPMPARAGAMRTLLKRLANLKALFRHDQVTGPVSQPTGSGRVLTVCFDEVWARVGSYTEGIDHDVVMYTDLSLDLCRDIDPDLVILGGCFCGYRHQVGKGLRLATAFGIPSLIPSDCGTRRLGLTVPGIHSDFLDTIDGWDPHLLWRGIPAALQERRAWLLAKGRPFPHLPRMSRWEDGRR